MFLWGVLHDGREANTGYKAHDLTYATLEVVVYPRLM